jgi:hypothetical protein
MYFINICHLSFLLFLLPWVSSTTLTFGYMLGISFYVYIILLVFGFGLYSTYERKYALFGFLNLTNFTYDEVLQFHPFTCT